MDRKKDLIKNTLIIGFGKVSTQLISFLLLPLYTLFLSPGEYGTVDLITTYIALLVPAVTLQLEMASFRFLVDARQNENEKKQIISNILQVISIILLVCTVLFLAVNAFFHLPYANLILLNIGVTIFSNLFLQFARGVGDNKKFAIACILTGITTLLTTILFIVYAHMGAEGMLLSVALANLVCALYLFFALRMSHYIDLKTYDKKLQKKLIEYSFPLIPNGVSWWVINVSDRTIISIAIGVAANGIYAVANKYAAIFSSAFSIFSMSWTESASMHINDKDRDKFFSETINASVRFFGSFGLVLIASIPLLFPFLVSAAYGEAYLYIPILIIAAFFNSIVVLYSAIYVAKKMTRQVANTSMVAAIINIVLTIVLMKFIGLYAAAISTAVAFLAMAIYRHYDVKKYISIRYDKQLILILIATYTGVTSSYYLNIGAVNIISFLLISIFALAINKSVIRMLIAKVFRKKLI
jgi:O-antigen/teichoic acid export membrane protein